MTKTHFEAIAAIFASRVPYCDPILEGTVSSEVLTLATDMADYFESVNPHFDRHRFLTACKNA